MQCLLCCQEKPVIIIKFYHQILFLHAMLLYISDQLIRDQGYNLKSS